MAEHSLTYHVDSEPTRVVLSRTRVGHAIDVGARFLIALPICWLISFAFFGFDHYGREAVGIPGYDGLGWSVLVFGAFAAFVVALARLMRRNVWTVDVGAEVVRLEAHKAWTDPQVVEVPLAELREVRTELRGLGRPSRVVMVFGDGEEPLVRSLLGAATIQPVCDAVEGLLESTPVSCTRG